MISTTRRIGPSLSRAAWLSACLLAGMLILRSLPLDIASLNGPGFQTAHDWLKLLSVISAALIFGLAWTAHDRQQARNIVLLGCAFLAVAVLDGGHLLATASPASVEKPDLLWHAARMIGAFALLAVVLLPWRPFGHDHARLALLGAAMVSVAAVFWSLLPVSNRMPVPLFPGELPGFAGVAGVSSLAMLAAAVLILAYRGRHQWSGEWHYLLASLAAMIVSELCFSSASGEHSLVHLLGHAYQVLGCGLVYRAILVFNVSTPIEQARQSEAHLRNVMESIPDGIAILDEDGCIVDVNDRVLAMFRCRREDMVAHPFETLLPERFRANHLAHWTTSATSGAMEATAQRRSGEEFPVEISLSQLANRGERSMLCVLRDISERKETEHENRRLASILAVVPDLVCVTDPDHRIVYLNPAGLAMLGRSPARAATALGTPGFYPHWAERRVLDEVMPEAARKGMWRGENAIMREDGSEISVMQTTIAHRGEQGKLLYWSHFIQDFRERKRLEKQIAHQATHDQLTGLPNRMLLLDRMRQAMAHAGRHERLVAVLLFDLDNFKSINDSFGHALGDDLLRQVARRLGLTLREGDTVARLGGDEFAVMLEDMATVEDVVQVVRKLQERLRQPFRLQETELGIDASIGITLCPLDEESPDDLLRDADIAMYEAKKRGRGGYCFYTQDMNSDLKERLAWLESLRRAVGNEEFVLHYQPKVDLASGRICGMEALARWQHPTRGLVPPNLFIPLAEESGLILPLGLWVLRAACCQNKAWQDAGLPPMRVAVNLSARQFRQEGLVELVAAALNDSGLDAGFLELEITESMVMDNAADSLKILHALKDLGISLSIDDFGTGYSSLSYLRQFPVDSLKVDRSFVRDAPFSPNDAAIAGAIISMAHSLGLRVVAEGVESYPHVEFLTRHRCDEMQGFLFSKPLPAEAFRRLLQEGCEFALSAA